MAGGVPRALWRASGRLGERIWAGWDEWHYAAAVIGTVLLVAVVPRYWTRPVRRAFVQQLMAIGVEAVGFVCGVAVVVGIVVVVNMVTWVAKAGQSQNLGPLLVIIVVRELAPVLVSLIVIIRSGSAMAVELALMKIEGQVHALEAQGQSPLLTLVLPRVLGVALSAFCLTIIFVLVSFVSGYIFGAILGQGSRDPLLLADSIASAMSLKDLLAVFCSSVLPGLYIGASCCIAGLAVGPAEVPQATQRALVRSVIGLFLISTVVSLLLHMA